MIDTTLNWLFKLIGLCQGVHVKVHQGIFNGGDTEYYFIKVVNTSPQRDIEVTHIWVDDSCVKPVAPVTSSSQAR